MLILPIAFLGLLAWGIKDDDLDWKEAILWTIPFALLCTAAVFWQAGQFVCVIAAVVLCAGLLYRVVGYDVIVR